MDAEVVAAFNKTPMTHWGFDIGDIIKKGYDIVKVNTSFALCAAKSDHWLSQYGLYDRPELQCWHQGRVLLIGDAAHPTSPVSVPLKSAQTSTKHYSVASRSRREPVYGRYRATDRPSRKT
jgi:hypothetical protein